MRTFIGAGSPAAIRLLPQTEIESSSIFCEMPKCVLWPPLILCLMLVFSSCVEAFDVSQAVDEERSLAGTLIVEGSLTTENKNQVILVSRMRQIRDSTVNVEAVRLFNANTPFIVPNGLGPAFESNALVQVEDTGGGRYRFEETAPGRYESVNAFGAQPNTAYKLQIITSDGMEYASDFQQTPPESTLDSLYAERVTSDLGMEGVGIFADATTPSDGTYFVRYTYEETYKIIAPNWTPLEFQIVRDWNPSLGIWPVVETVPRAQEEQVCYRTDSSATIVLLDPAQLQKGQIRRNEIRFLGRDNPIIAHRYSILVRQRVISGEAFSFYERLRNFSLSESVFSQIQPGPLEGNVSAIPDGGPVLGFFEVASETSTRIYFNFVDFFPDEPLPPYFIEDLNCDRLLSPPLPDPELDGPPSPDGQCPFPLIDRIKLNLVEYVGINEDPGICEGPYFITQRPCGDCTTIGSNVAPDFWEE